jgi:hypothetical protein
MGGGIPAFDNGWTVSRSQDGLYFIGGGSTTLPLQGSSYWNGYVYNLLDAQIYSGASIRASLWNGNDLYLGYDTTGTIRTSALTSVVPKATESVYPKLILVGPTTAGTTATLTWLENQSTNERLYLNYTIQGGETVTLDFAPGNKIMKSDWNGTILSQPMSGSDFASFHLLPTTNTISTFIYGVVGSTTGLAAILTWTPTHWSLDGGA